MQESGIKDWLPLLVGIITATAALLGVAISTYISHRNTRATLKEQRQLRADERRLERMEELFVTFARWEMNLSQIYLIDLRRHKGLLTTTQVQELVANLNDSNKADIHRMAMLLRIHFPELAHQYAAVQDARKKLTPFLDDSLPTNFESFARAQEHFESVCEVFKKTISHLPKFSEA